MCRYRLRLDGEVIIWRCLSANRSPFVWRESGNDVQHNAHAQKAENHTNLNGRERKLVECGALTCMSAGQKCVSKLLPESGAFD